MGDVILHERKCVLFEWLRVSYWFLHTGCVRKPQEWQICTDQQVHHWQLCSYGMPWRYALSQLLLLCSEIAAICLCWPHWGLPICLFSGGRYKKEALVDGQSHLLLIREEPGLPDAQVRACVCVCICDRVIFIGGNWEPGIEQNWESNALIQRNRTPLTLSFPLVIAGCRPWPMGLSEYDVKIDNTIYIVSSIISCYKLLLVYRPTENCKGKKLFRKLIKNWKKFFVFIVL